MFVVTLPRSATHPLAFAKKAKRAGAEILEIRGDLTPDVAKFSSPLPILVAVRGVDHRLVQRMEPDYIDVETQNFASLPRKSKLILSFHDHDATPSLAILKATVNRMRKEKPWAIKIATFVKSYDDLVTLKKLQDWLVSTRQRSIVLGMGPLAHLTRVLSPFRNVLTYASLDGYDRSAIGQLPLSFYRLLKGRKNPKILGIIGGPHITVSLSPVIHNALFLRHRVDAVYSCFPMTDFRSSVKRLDAIGLHGCSVTAPFKHDAFLFARTRHASAEAIGVANTLRRGGKGWKAWNTDGDGIEHGYPFLASTQALAILGAGGAVPSVIRAARHCNPNVIITIFARDPKKAKKMLSAVETQNFASLQIQNLGDALNFKADTVICAISQDIAVPIPISKTAIDLRYGTETKFMVDARKKGMKVYDGVPMLIGQALKQFQHFTGKTPYDDDDTFLRSILTSFLSSHGR